VIKFSCKNCGQRFKVSDIDAGKKAKCPKCKNIVIIPKYKTTEPEVPVARATDDKTKPEKSPLDSAVFDVPPPEQISQTIEDKKYHEDIHTMYDGIAGTASYESKEEASERKLPWIIDIFLYPISTPGLTNLGIFIIVPLLVKIMGLLLGPFAFVSAIAGLIINTLIGLYMVWYFAECIRDSASGGIRAPEAFTIVDVGEMLWQTLLLAGCYLVFFGPPAFYFLYTHKIDTILWLLLAYGVFFFPMGLLAVVMFKSDSALNPILLISSIFKTFFQYCGLVLVLSVVVLAVHAVNQIQLDNWVARVLGFITSCVLIYLALVIAHLLGRFYWKYQEKLNWEV